MKKYIKFIILLISLITLLAFLRITIFVEFLKWNEDYCDKYLSSTDNKEVVFRIIELDGGMNNQRRHIVLSNCYTAVTRILSSKKFTPLDQRQINLIKKAFIFYKDYNFSLKENSQILENHNIFIDKMNPRANEMNPRANQ